MNDDDLTTILRRGGGRQELPADVAARVQADMHEELDRTLGGEAAVLSLRPSLSSPAGRPRHFVRIAAAVLLIAATLGLLLSQREADVNEANPAQEVPLPPQRPYLVACLDFIDSTSNDDQPWHGVLADPVATIPPDYLATLAKSIDQLLATNPEGGTAASQLHAAAVEARSADPDLDLIVQQLESAQDTLYEETGVSCLTGSSRDRWSD